MRFLVGSIIAVLVASLALFLAGAHDTAVWLSLLGTFGALMLTMAYVVFFDSRKRWPELGWWDRYVKVITFER